MVSTFLIRDRRPEALVSILTFYNLGDIGAVATSFSTALAGKVPTHLVCVHVMRTSTPCFALLCIMTTKASICSKYFYSLSIVLIRPVFIVTGRFSFHTFLAPDVDECACARLRSDLDLEVASFDPW